MRPRAVRRAILTFALLSLWSAPAYAWTDAAVRSATARVTLSDDASTVHVELMAQLRIDGGWLEAFELDGLDEGLVLDPSVPPTFELWERPRWAPAVDASDEPVEDEAPGMIPEPVFVSSLEPRVSVHGSRIAMAFRRRAAPRAGLYRARVTYDAPAADYVVRSAQHAELRWTLPAWRNGLDDVQVTLVLPPGSTAIALSEDEDASIDVSEAESAEGEIFTFTRVHLPRTQSWTIRAELPVSFRLPARPDAAAPIAADITAAPRQSSLLSAIAVLLLSLLVVAKSTQRARDAAQLHAFTGALLPMAHALRMALVLAVLLGSWASLLWMPDRFALGPVAIALLGLHGASGLRPSARRLGSFRSAWGRASERAHDAHRAWLARRWLDATTPPGIAVAVAVLVALFVAHHLELVSPETAFVLGTAFVITLMGGHGLRGPHATLGALLARARDLTVHLERGIALAPLLHVDIQGRVQTGRLRVVLPSPPDGLTRSDLVLDEGTVRLLLAARRGSEAERCIVVFAAEAALNLAPSDPYRVVLVCGLDRLDAVGRALSPEADAPALRRAS